MKIILTFCFSFVIFYSVFAQDNVQYSTSKKRIKLPFKLVNNLVILPIKVNGVALNFLVDTGVEETILFSLDEKKEIPLYDVAKVKLRGLGTQDAVEGLKAYRNTLSVNGVEFKNQEIIVILDQTFNFSSALGIEVNGIIGSHFFSHTIVKVDYCKKKITLYDREKYNDKILLNKYQVFDIELVGGRPYIAMKVQIKNIEFNAKCLIDSGNSDGLWLFQNTSDTIIVPDRNFEDYLGRGFSGPIFGKKARVKKLSLQDYIFENVITAFPDEISFKDLKMVEDRVGSIGGEFLRRFNLVFDYKNHKMYLRKNKNYKDKFRYNTAGVTVHHAGLQWHMEELPVEGFDINQDNPYRKSAFAELKYNFKLLPLYEIHNIRTNSPAEKAGLLAGDVLVSVNGVKVYRMNLEKINQLLKADDGEEIKITIVREGREFTYRFKITDLL